MVNDMSRIISVLREIMSRMLATVAKPNSLPNRKDFFDISISMFLISFLLTLKLGVINLIAIV